MTTYQAVLEKVRFYYRQVLNRSVLQDSRIDGALSHMADVFEVYISGFLAGKTNAEVDVTFPCSWWDAVKDRWYPKWAKRRWPPRYRHIVCNSHTVFPAIKLPEKFGEPVVLITRQDSDVMWSDDE